jgi:hypothetical protein
MTTTQQSAVKQPWEMTRGEFHKQHRIVPGDLGGGGASFQPRTGEIALDYDDQQPTDHDREAMSLRHEAYHRHRATAEPSTKAHLQSLEQEFHKIMDVHVAHSPEARELKDYVKFGDMTPEQAKTKLAEHRALLEKIMTHEWGFGETGEEAAARVASGDKEEIRLMRKALHARPARRMFDDWTSRVRQATAGLPDLSHHNIVKEAIAAGHPVPAHVRAEYPTLANSPTTPEARYSWYSDFLTRANVTPRPFDEWLALGPGDEPERYYAASPRGWLAVDLDGTLARYDDRQGQYHIGEPVPEMVNRVKGWLASGREVRIFTARVYGPDAERQRRAIEQWCRQYIGRVLPITSQKDPGMYEFWDDRAIQVARNTGRPIGRFTAEQDLDHENYAIEITPQAEDPWRKNEWGTMVHEFTADTPTGTLPYKAVLAQNNLPEAQHQLQHVGKSYIFTFRQPNSENPYGVTGTGGAPGVFSHVGSALVDALHRHQPASVLFSADEPSRRKLYHRLVGRVSEHHPDYIGYAMNSAAYPMQEDLKQSQQFAIVHRDYAPKFELHQKRMGEYAHKIASKKPQTEQTSYSMTAAEIDEAVKDWSPPTAAQREAGNYQKPTINWNGLRIKIENPRGTKRKPEWKPLAHHYGYISRTEDRDGDAVDCYIGPHSESEIVFVVDQEHPGGRFDEHKVCLAFRNAGEARQGYLDNYKDGWHCGPVTAMTIEQFKQWLQRGDTTARVADQVSRYTAGDIWQDVYRDLPTGYDHLAEQILIDRYARKHLKSAAGQRTLHFESAAPTGARKWTAEDEALHPRDESGEFAPKDTAAAEKKPAEKPVADETLAQHVANLHDAMQERLQAGRQFLARHDGRSLWIPSADHLRISPDRQTIEHTDPQGRWVRADLAQLDHWADRANLQPFTGPEGILTKQESDDARPTTPGGPDRESDREAATPTDHPGDDRAVEDAGPAGPGEGRSPGEAREPERLKGGKSDGRPDSDFDPEALAKGIEHEAEHTDDPKVAAEIAKDHLLTDGMDYYDRLDEQERDTRPPEIREAEQAIQDLNLHHEPDQRTAMERIKEVADRHGVPANDLWRELMYEPDGMGRDIERELEEPDDREPPAQPDEPDETDEPPEDLKAEWRKRLKGKPTFTAKQLADDEIKRVPELKRKRKSPSRYAAQATDELVQYRAYLAVQRERIAPPTITGDLRTFAKALYSQYHAQAERYAVQTPEDLGHASATENGIEFTTGKPVRFPYIHNTERSPRMGPRFGQDLEPHGRYIQYHSNPDPAGLPKNMVSGEIEFKNPLVIAHAPDDIYGPQGWKARLSRAHGGLTGKRLSQALARAGHDGIVTVDPRHRVSSEIVDLTMFHRPPAP